MKFSKEPIIRLAQELGYEPIFLEKVLLLMDLLEFLFKDPFLKEKLVLKGGTALNLFIFQLPRLSVDIDLNYIGAIDRQTMLKERPLVEQKISSICSRRNFQIKRMPNDHAGGKCILSYKSEFGGPGNLELDLNFLLRVPLFETSSESRFSIDNYQISEIPILDKHELVAGKLAALFSRNASRDLFDIYQIFVKESHKLNLDDDKLKLAFIVYGAMSRTDWRKISLNDIVYDFNELENRLVPLLSKNYLNNISDIKKWSMNLLKDSKQALNFLFPLKANEIEFLRLLNENGEINPKLLTDDESIIRRISNHPGIKWKAFNVKEYKKQI